MEISLSPRLVNRRTRPAHPGGEGEVHGSASDHSLSSLSSTSVSSFMDHSGRGGQPGEEEEESSWTDVETRVSGGEKLHENT